MNFNRIRPAVFYSNRKNTLNEKIRNQISYDENSSNFSVFQNDNNTLNEVLT